MARLPHIGGGMAVAIFCSLAAIVVVLDAYSALGKGGSRAQTPPHQTHSVDLKWKASTSHVAGYYVYRSDDSSNRYRKLTAGPIHAATYTDRTIQSGHAYSYRVTAVDDKGLESVHSNEVKAFVPSP